MLIKRLTRALRESSNISREPEWMNWLRSMPSLLFACFIFSRITESAGEPQDFATGSLDTMNCHLFTSLLHGITFSLMHA